MNKQIFAIFVLNSNVFFVFGNIYSCKVICTPQKFTCTLAIYHGKVQIMAFNPSILFFDYFYMMRTFKIFSFPPANIAGAQKSPVTVYNRPPLHEIKRCLLLGRKAMTNLDSILKSRDITLPTKFHLVKAMVFLVVMYGCEYWTIRKAECQRIDDFECWRRLLRVPWTARRLNQSFLKEISPEYSLEGLMLKLKLQYFGHLLWRADSLEKILMLVKTEGRRRGDSMRCLHSITDSVNMNISKLQETVKDREAWCTAIHRGAKSKTILSDWTTTAGIQYSNSEFLKVILNLWKWSHSVMSNSLWPHGI